MCICLYIYREREKHTNMSTNNSYAVQERGSLILFMTSGQERLAFLPTPC